MTTRTKRRIGAVMLSGGLAAGTLGVGLGFPASASASAAATTTAAVTAAPAVALPAWPVLRQGSNSAWPKVTVRSLQYLLNARGAKVTVDGVYGAKTKAAVVSFQRAHHLTADGVVGGTTWSALIVTVKLGSTGPAVRAVQDQANFRNGESGQTLAVDGILGQRTAVWVGAFQYVEGLTPDGVVGVLTWQALVTESLAG
jgi:peptidoglycan hydrolase-like protein with peptidoglycan-binding domain